MELKEERKPLDVWLRFEGDEYEDASHEANTFKNADGGYDVEWYHVDVGQVSTRTFDSYREARVWLLTEGFSDFTS